MIGTTAAQEREADRTFTVVSVCAPGRRLDVAVPDDMTGAELRQALLSEIGASGDVLVLDHPTRGPIPLDATVGSLALADGTVLSLRPASGSETVRPVDDVAESVADGTAASPAWTWESAHLVSAGLLAAWAVTGVVSSVLVRPVSMQPYVSAVSVLVLIVGQVLARGTDRRREQAVLAWTSVPVAGLGAWLASGQVWPGLVARGVAVAAAVWAAVAVAALIDPVRARWVRPVGVAFGAATPAAAVAGLGPWWGWSPERCAAVVAVATLAGLGLVTKAALSTSGLLRLDTDSAEGMPVVEEELSAGTARAARDMTASLVGLGAGGAGAGIVLMQGSLWPTLTGVMLVVAMACRARGFWRREHVGVLIAASVAAVAGAALLAAATAPSTPLAPVVLLGAVPLGLLVAFETRTIQQARAMVWLDRLEVVALVAVVPLVAAVFDVYRLVYDRFN